MGNNYIIFFIILISIKSLFCAIIYTELTLNDGTDNEIISLHSNGIRIFTEIEKSSTIKVDLSPLEAFDTNVIFYGRTKINRGEPEKREIPSFTKYKNKLSCTYTVSKSDDFKYGVLIIDEVSVLEQIIISVNVVSNSTLWIILGIVSIVVILIIIGIVVICKKFYRCICCSRKKE